jgi:splicing factor 1
MAGGILVTGTDIPTVVPSTISPCQLDAYLSLVRITEISQKLQTSSFTQYDLPDPYARGPPPAPTYDANGRQTNSPAALARDYLLRCRLATVERGLAHNPLFLPPKDFTSPVGQTAGASTGLTTTDDSGQFFGKIYVPVHTDPNFNWIGILIGPRGSTQRQLQDKTGATIAIRGKGSDKPGRGRHDGRPNEGADEPLHVRITADTQASLAAAERLIRELLVPRRDEDNQVKQAQLRMLNEINGVAGQRADEFEPCTYCGATDHRQWACPHRKAVDRAPGQGPDVAPPGITPAKRAGDVIDGFVASLGLDEESVTDDEVPPWRFERGIGPISHDAARRDSAAPGVPGAPGAPALGLAPPGAPSAAPGAPGHS